MMRKILFLILPLVIVAAALLIFTRNDKPMARIAFVIDDWGYNFDNIDLVSQIDRPLTISILPNLRYSRRIAETMAGDDRRDVILHLPLESKSDAAAEINTIRMDMTEDKILSILIDDIENIPGLIGVSNHQGSEATGDKRVMGTVFRELKERDLFFLDSLTTPDSVCSELAREIGVRYTIRDVFLDITDQTDLKHFDSYIRKQINELANVALKEGTAVGVGHNKEITLKAIRDSIKDLEKKGIEIVSLKELVR